MAYPYPPGYLDLTMTDYISMRSYRGFMEGIQQAYFLFDKLPPEETLSVVAAFQALRNVSHEEGIELIQYEAFHTMEREHAAVAEACTELLNLAQSRGVNVNALMPQLRAAYTQEAKNFVRAIREANKPKGFFDRLFG
jgi:hypothetical protein